MTHLSLHEFVQYRGIVDLGQNVVALNVCGSLVSAVRRMRDRREKLPTGMYELAFCVQEVEREQDSLDCCLEKIFREPLVLPPMEHVAEAIPHRPLNQASMIASITRNRE